MAKIAGVMPMITKPNILDILHTEGVELKQRGRNFISLCVFHTERTPSFYVDPERQHWKCFGCGASGDVVDFAMKFRGLSFRDALSYLGISSVDVNQVKHNSMELKKRKLIQKFRRWIQLYRRAICELLRLANRIDLQVATPEGLELSGIGEMYLKKFIYEYHLDILNGSCDETKFKLYQEYLDGCNELHS